MAALPGSPPLGSSLSRSDARPRASSLSLPERGLDLRARARHAGAGFGGVWCHDGQARDGSRDGALAPRVTLSGYVGPYPEAPLREALYGLPAAGVE